MQGFAFSCQKESPIRSTGTEIRWMPEGGLLNRWSRLLPVSSVRGRGRAAGVFEVSAVDRLLASPRAMTAKNNGAPWSPAMVALALDLHPTSEEKALQALQQADAKLGPRPAAKQSPVDAQIERLERQVLELAAKVQQLKQQPDQARQALAAKKQVQQELDLLLERQIAGDVPPEARQPPVHLHTFGFGYSLDSALLEQLAAPLAERHKGSTKAGA